jgi:hypothetical protein
MTLFVNMRIIVCVSIMFLFAPCRGWWNTKHQHYFSSKQPKYNAYPTIKESLAKSTTPEYVNAQQHFMKYKNCESLQGTTDRKSSFVPSHGANDNLFHTTTPNKQQFDPKAEYVSDNLAHKERNEIQGQIMHERKVMDWQKIRSNGSALWGLLQQQVVVYKSDYVVGNQYIPPVAEKSRLPSWTTAATTAKNTAVHDIHLTTDARHKHNHRHYFQQSSNMFSVHKKLCEEEKEKLVRVIGRHYSRVVPLLCLLQ